MMSPTSSTARRAGRADVESLSTRGARRLAFGLADIVEIEGRQALGIAARGRPEAVGRELVLQGARPRHLLGLHVDAHAVFALASGRAVGQQVKAFGVGLDPA